MTSSDLSFHSWPPDHRSGGRHVTKCLAGVLVVHRPTGLAATCTSERSQMANREKATAMLRDALVRLGHVEAPKPDPATCPHVNISYDRRDCFDCGAELPP